MTKILVIEDEEAIREIIREILIAEHFDVIVAANGQSGVQLALSQTPDLIISDIIMPGLDGYDVLSRLRQNPLTETIPFIFLTARAAKTDLRQGMRLGADDYLTKPFTRNELVEAIAARLEKQAAITQHYTNALKRTAQELNHLVHYDSLTKLPKQQLLRERFNQLLSQTHSNQRLIPILSLDFDRFNRIHDTLGYLHGDLLLKLLAQRLTNCVSSNNMVARLNAGDFVVILTTINQKQDAANLAQATLNALSQRFVLDGQVVFITASIGIAFHPFDGSDIDTLLKNARAARHHAQRQGGNNYKLYSVDINISSSRQLTLEASLHRALEQSELQVYYQPQVSLHTGKIVGAEALGRWQHPEFGFISPAEFIPLAEETGLITSLGEWILRTACVQTKIWQTAGFSLLRVAVNLSGRQFSQQNLTQRIAQILKETAFAPEYLELELTESILLQDVKAAFLTLNELRLLGIQISIDDFGTGYSSLGYLNKLPFNNLKIDQCFIRNITVDSKDAAITTAIIQMAHSLNLKVVAEGVETAAELAFLSQNQCDEIQGYLFSRPLPASEFEKLLISGKRLNSL